MTKRRRGHRAIAAMLAGLCGLALTAGRPAIADTLVGTWQNWEVRRYDAGPVQCIARAFHPAILQGEVLWIVEPDGDGGASGYLAVDRRLAEDAAAVTVTVDDRPARQLTEGGDGWFYSEGATTPRLRRDFRAGLEATLRFDQAGGGDRTVTVPLTGFTAATEAAATACGVPEAS
jgi:hypothetical protein